MSALRGGEWLVTSSDASDVFTPERLSEEHRLIAKTVTDFVEAEVLPNLDRLEQKDWALARDLVRRCGALGQTCLVGAGERAGGAAGLLGGNGRADARAAGAGHGCRRSDANGPHRRGDDLQRSMSGRRAGADFAVRRRAVDRDEYRRRLADDHARRRVAHGHRRWLDARCLERCFEPIERNRLQITRESRLQLRRIR